MYGESCPGSCPGPTAGRSGSSGGAGLYTVRAIWEHWVINREWWREPADSGDAGTGPGQPELVFWRVEAAPGQGMTPGVYELRQDVATGAWTIRLN